MKMAISAPRRRMLVGAVIALIFFLSVTLFVYERRQEDQALQSALGVHAAVRAQGVLKEVEEHLETLSLLADWFRMESQAGKQVESASLAALARALQAQNTDLFLLAEARRLPLLPPAGGAPGAGAGGDRAVYRVEWVEPPGARPLAVGSDLATHPLFAPLVERVSRSGRLGVSSRVPCPEKDEGEYDVWLLQPLLRHQYEGSIPEGGAPPAAMLVAVLDIADIMERVLGEWPPVDLSWLLTDDAASPGEEVLFASGGRTAASGAHWRTELQLSEHKSWTLSARPGPAFSATHVRRNSLPLLLGGLSFALLAGVLLASILGRTEQVESEVRERTAHLTHEIAEREHAESLLRESEGRYRALAENAEDLIYVAGLDGRVSYANRHAARCAGLPPEELVGVPVSAFTPGISAEDYAGLMAQLAAGQTVKSTFPAVLQGKEYWLDLVLVPLRNDAREVTGILGIARDVTEGHRAVEKQEEALLRQQGFSQLRQSLLAPASLEDKLRNVTDSVVRLFDADFCRIWVIRPGDRCEQGCMHAEAREGPHVCRSRERCLHLLASSGRYTHLDGRGHRRVPFGCYKIGRIASSDEHKFVTNDVPNDPQVHDHAWARELGLVSFAGYQLRAPGGETLGVLALFARRPLLPDEDAILDGLGSTAALVIQQADVEAALRFNNVLLSTQQEASLDGILVVDERARILSYNRRFIELWGLPANLVEDKLDAPVLQFVTAQLRDPPSFLERVHDIYAHKESASRDDLLLADGRVVDRYSTPMVGGDKRYYGRAWFFRDVTERRDMESKLRSAKEAAEEAARAKGDFLATMSHEIRTPLNGIIGTVGLLLDEPLSTRQRELVEIAHTSANILLALINDILDFSKIEARRLTIEPVSFDPAHLLAEVAALFAASAAGKGLELVARPAAGVPPRVIGDAGRIRQVLMNLVGNAVKFTDRGRVLLGLTRDGGGDGGGAEGLRFSVEDTGCGIPEERQQRLFERFVQGDASTTRRCGGTGLGLAISRSLVELMGGTIGVESRSGDGATFWFRLPLPRDPHPPPAPPDAAAAPSAPATRVPRRDAGVGRPLRALVVEDNAINQRVAVLTLESLGCRADVAANGREAVAMVEGFPYDLVLMDCEMPEMDGFEAAREMRRREAGGGRRLRIVAMTARAGQGDRERCLAAGMDDYLGKPVSPAQIAAVLESGPRTREEGAEAGPSAIDPCKAGELRRLCGSRERWEHLADLFENGVGELLGRLRAASASGDAGEMHAAAHRLKGACANFGAQVMVEISSRLDEQALGTRTAAAAELLAGLEEEWARVRAALGAERRRWEVAP